MDSEYDVGVPIDPEYATCLSNKQVTEGSLVKADGMQISGITWTFMIIAFPIFTVHNFGGVRFSSRHGYVARSPAAGIET